MKAAATLLCGFLLASVPATAGIAHEIAVVINDRPAELRGLLVSQKVLMPMRALFSALGASVQYDSRLRKVYARTSSHRIALSIGSHGSRLVHFRTYVPLRFVAETLGATVDYDAPTRSVAIYSAGSSQSARDGATLWVSARYPEPGQRVAGGYAITARLDSRNGASVRRSALHMFLDGADVAFAADFDGSNLSYRPSTALGYGRHDVRLDGVDEEGHRFSSQWWWFQDFPTPSYNGYNGYAGYSGFGFPPYPNGINLGFRFYPTGPVTYISGDIIQLILVAPAGGNAFVRFCGLPQIFYLNYNAAFNYYAVSLPAPRGYYLPVCTVTAFYNNHNGVRRIIPLRSHINIFTKPRDIRDSAPARGSAGLQVPKAMVPPVLKRRIKPMPAVSLPPVPAPHRSPTPVRQLGRYISRTK